MICADLAFYNTLFIGFAFVFLLAAFIVFIIGFAKVLDDCVWKVNSITLFVLSFISVISAVLSISFVTKFEKLQELQPNKCKIVVMEKK